MGDHSQIRLEEGKTGPLRDLIELSVVPTVAVTSSFLP